MPLGYWLSPARAKIRQWPANLRVQDFPRQRDKDSPVMVPLFSAQFAAGASPWRNPYAMGGVTPLSQQTTAE